MDNRQNVIRKAKKRDDRKDIQTGDRRWNVLSQSAPEIHPSGKF